MNTEIENPIDSDVTLLKLADAANPGFIVDVDPDEAELLGAFVEDALSEQDALEGGADLWNGEPDDNKLNQWLGWGLA
jgi:hypothetical protein